MATRKITQLTELAEAPHDDDEFIIVDVSDTTMSPEGTNKRLKASNLPSGGGGGSNKFEFSNSLRANASVTGRYYYGNSAYGWNYVAWNLYATSFTDVFYGNCSNGVAVPDAFTNISMRGVMKSSVAGDDIELTCWRTPNPNGVASNVATTQLLQQTITPATNNVHYQISASATGVSLSQNDLIFFTVHRTSGSGGTQNIDLSVTIQCS